MKNFEFLFCFLLCVLPCVFTENDPEQIEFVAKKLNITPKGLLKCLDQVNTDFESIFELSDLLIYDTGSASQENVTKIGCFGACVSKQSGLLVNSKIVPEKVVKIAENMQQSKEEIALLDEAAKKCSKQVSGRTNDCDIIVYFSRCVVREVNIDK